MITRIRGFTLTEMSVVVLLSGIILSASIPALRGVILDTRMQARQLTLLGALNLARLEALSHNLPVVICASDRPAEASPVCNNGDNEAWQNGWFMFIDADRDREFDDDSDQVLRIFQGWEADTATVSKSGLSDVAKKRVAFAPNGTSRAWGGTFLICDERGFDDGTAVVLSPIGRVRTANPRDTSHTACPATASMS